MDTRPAHADRMLALVSLVVAVLLALSSPLTAQNTTQNAAQNSSASAADDQCSELETQLVIPLDDTGIGDWSYPNPRVPYPVLRKRTPGRLTRTQEAPSACWTEKNLEKVLILFDNRTSDRTFDVQVDLLLESPLDRLREELRWLAVELQTRALPEPPRPVDRLRLQQDLDQADARVDAQMQRLEDLESEITWRQEIGAPTAIFDRRLTAGRSKLADLQAQVQRLEQDLANAPSRPTDIERSAMDAETLTERLARFKRLAESTEILQAFLVDELDALRSGTLPDDASSPEIRELEEDLAALSAEKDEYEQEIAMLEQIRSDQAKRAQETKTTDTRAASLAKLFSRLDEDERLELLARLLASDGDVVDEIEETFDLQAATLPISNPGRGLALRNCQDRLDEIKSKFPSPADLDEIRTVCLEGDNSLKAQLGDGELEAFESTLEDAENLVDVFTQGFGGSRSSDQVCRAEGADALRCTLSLNPGPRQQVQIAGDLVPYLERSTQNGIATIKVSFANEAEIPSNSQAYLQVAATFQEAKSTTSWSLSATSGYRRNPLPPTDEMGDAQMLTPDSPYEGDEARHLPASGSLELVRTLGNRASGKATFSFKSGDLGNPDEDNDVEVSNYFLQVYGKNGAQFRFGKYRFFSNFAASASGEGFEWFWRNLNLGMVLERESESGTADDDDEDKRELFFRARNLSPGRDTQVVTRFDVLGLWGEDELEDVDAEYWTAGGSAFFAIPKLSEALSLSGDLSYYRSEKSYGVPTTEGFVDGEGNSWLLTATATDVANTPSETKHFKPGSSLYSVSLQVGHGDGDDPATPTIDEGYLGETPAFAPDKLFLRDLTRRIADEHGRVHLGLENKTYFGLQYTDKRFSPLQFFVSLLDAQETVSDRSTTITYHRYRYDEPVYGEREIGSELDVDFSIAAPKGVRYTLGLGWFFAGDAVEEIFPEEPWLLDFTVSVNLN